jgi:hypothetical protein
LILVDADDTHHGKCLELLEVDRSPLNGGVEARLILNRPLAAESSN